MELLAQGRACDVFVVDDRTVLRRARSGASLEREATLMRHVRDHGFPCPAVIDASGADMVLERLDGLTLTAHLVGDTATMEVDAGARLVAELHQRLHALPPMPGEQGSVLHLDLHPENVIVTAGGPVVIDWTNGRHGNPADDVAMTWLILAPFVGVLDGVDRFIDVFLDAVGRDQAVAGLAAAGARRLADPNTTPDEARVVSALIASGGSPTRP